MIISRPVQKEDWDRINWLASDSVQEADHSQFDAEWTRKRREFAHEELQSVVEKDGKVVGYCALEIDESKDGFRVFLVADWSLGAIDLHTSLFDELERLISNAKTRKVWMRELAGDATLIDFVVSKGFSVEKRYEFDGLQLVNLIKDYENS